MKGRRKTRVVLWKLEKDQIKDNQVEEKKDKKYKIL